MAGELIDPEQAKALMDAVNRSRAEADRRFGIPEHQRLDWGEDEDALARASAGMKRFPLPPEYLDPEYMGLLGGYDAPYMDVRAALNRNPHYREDYDYEPQTPFGYPDFGGDVFGTVGEQVMSMMPPQEPLPPEIMAEQTQRPRPTVGPQIDWSSVVPPAELGGFPPQPERGFGSIPGYMEEEIPYSQRRGPPGESLYFGGMRSPTGTLAAGEAMRSPDPGRAAQVEQLMRELEEQQALEARLQAMGR